MPWTIVMVTKIRLSKPQRAESGKGVCQRAVYTIPDGAGGTRDVQYDELPVGACWHTDQLPARATEKRFNGPERSNTGPSLCVVLPGRNTWYLHHPGTNGFLWEVTGNPPSHLSATPSINIVGQYHGYVGAGPVGPGWVSDDVEGRRFNDDGTPKP